MLHGVRLLMLFLSITFGAALMMSLVTVVVENWSIHRSQVNRDALRYRGMGDWLKLVFYSIISDFSYSYLRIVWQMKGMIRFFQGEKSWNKFSRRGVTKLGDEE